MVKPVVERQLNVEFQHKLGLPRKYSKGEVEIEICIPRWVDVK